jgi:hypothetical protein
MFGESKPDYVNRKVTTFRKDRQRTAEREGTQLDPHEFEQETLRAKHEAEDSWDFWHGEATWPW